MNNFNNKMIYLIIINKKMNSIKIVKIKMKNISYKIQIKLKINKIKIKNK
jgi:hypothetical protein